MRDPVWIVFIFFLKISPKLTPNVIYKSFRINKIFAKEYIEFVSGNRNVRLYLNLMPTIIQILATTNTVSKKIGRIQEAIIAGGSSYVKMVFSLQKKILTI